jgi:hypothetical protein
VTSPKQADEQVHYTQIPRLLREWADRELAHTNISRESHLGYIAARELERSHLQPPGEQEGREIIRAMIDDLALRARLKSSRTGLQADAALDISDGILERAQEYLAAPASGEAGKVQDLLAAVAYIKSRRCTNPKPVGDSACDCCQHHWAAIDGYIKSSRRPGSTFAQGTADGCRQALENLVTLILQTSVPIGPMRSREDYPHELRAAISALRSAELTLEETQRLLGAESPIPVNVPTDPIALAAAASQSHGQLRHPATQVDADVQVHHSDIADLNPVLELRSPVVEALTELVALKKLKDANTVDGMWLLDSPHIEYDRRKPLAWEKAREALARHPGAEALSAHDFHLLSRIENIIRQSHPDEASGLYALWKRLRSPVAQGEADDSTWRRKVADSLIKLGEEGATRAVLRAMIVFELANAQRRHPSHPTGADGWLPCEPQKQVGFSYFLQTLYRKRSDGQWFAYYVPDLPDYKAAPPKPTAPDGGGL